jgi:phosphatidylethanolamine-binding protein (PEBP) family uncharacterized protein
VFDGAVVVVQLVPGTILSVKETQHAPRLEWALSAPSASGQSPHYTVIMCDPDAPSREHPKFRCWLHWCVTNVVHPNSLGEGYEVTSYMGPAPPAKTGLHRYCFLVYKQNGVFDVSKLHKIPDDKRGGWQIKGQHTMHKWPPRPLFAAGQLKWLRH